MRLADYYGDPFRRDLENVLAHAPRGHEHDYREITIQPRSISSLNPVVQRWEPEHRALFACALFLTVLADVVCYTHFEEHYPEFRRLTMYPKLRGDCPGGCSTHIHPASIFAAIGQRPGLLRLPENYPYEALPPDWFAVMEKEIRGFCESHLPALDAEQFWRRCDAEVPVHFRLSYMAVRRSAV